MVSGFRQCIRNCQGTLTARFVCKVTKKFDLVLLRIRQSPTAERQLNTTLPLRETSAHRQYFQWLSKSFIREFIMKSRDERMPAVQSQQARVGVEGDHAVVWRSIKVNIDPGYKPALPLVRVGAIARQKPRAPARFIRLRNPQIPGCGFTL